MFAPSFSRPPYYPSYTPPNADELESLFSSHAYMAHHGNGAENECWKVQHGVYITNEADMRSTDIQKTTHALQTMKKFMQGGKGDQTKTEDEKAATAAASSSNAVDTSLTSTHLTADPSILMYTDFHAYTNRLERENISLFTHLSYSSEKLAMLKNTPFIRYLYHGALLVDIGRLDDEMFTISMQFLERTTNVHTLMIHDSWYLQPSSKSSSSSSSVFRPSKSRGHPIFEKQSEPGAGKSASSAGAKSATIRMYPNEKKVTDGLETNLSLFLHRNASSLVHIELYGLHLGDWSGIFRHLRKCTQLQRLYLKKCNIGDKTFSELVLILKSHLTNLNALQLSNIGITSLSASLICSLIKIQSAKRNMLHWQEHLREDASATPPITPSILLSHDLHALGLISLDISDHEKLGDKGISMICDTLSRDTWLKAVDMSGCGCSEEGLESIVNMLKENKTLLWVQVHGPREKNVNRSDELYHQATAISSGKAPLDSLSGNFLLQQLDPHFTKRSKRLLLLFHQQNIELERFLTGRQPTISMEQLYQSTPIKFPSPGAGNIFTKFFTPRQIVEPASTEAVTPVTSPYRRASSSDGKQKTKKRVMFGGADSSTTNGDALLSPLIRSLSVKRDGGSRVEDEEKAIRNDSAAAATSPQTPALNFLFPKLHLVVPPSRLLHADISLRAKPARSDNAWVTASSTDSSLLSPRLNKSRSVLLLPSDPLAHREQDFRPCLIESCVANTRDYVTVEKEKYKRALKAKMDGTDNGSIAQFSTGKKLKPRAKSMPPQTLEQEESKSGTSTFAVPPASAIKLVSKETMISISSIQEESKEEIKEQVVVENTTKTTEISTVIDVVVPPKSAAPSHHETHSMPLPVDEWKASNEQPPSANDYPVNYSIEVTEPSEPTTAAAENTQPGFNIASLSHALTAAASAATAGAHDPALLTFLEDQFHRLHSYMDLLESQPELMDQLTSPPKAQTQRSPPPTALTSSSSPSQSQNSAASHSQLPFPTLDDSPTTAQEVLIVPDSAAHTLPLQSSHEIEDEVEVESLIQQNLAAAVAKRMQQMYE